MYAGRVIFPEMCGKWFDWLLLIDHYKLSCKWRILIGFGACRQNIAGNQKIITVTDNYMYVAIQLQGSFLKRFFSRSKKF